MSLGGKAPKPPPVIPPAPDTAPDPMLADEDKARQRRRGYASTVLTSPLGVPISAPTGQTTLLGRKV